ncbi:Hpt domain-containing protein [Pseudomonas aeruginosa]|nr:Hpt domain-containing protein [Pseudomonas aeruginosa]EKX4397376.1 Hpt domain-containing protein [Pseudomonas aeruginosa]
MGDRHDYVALEWVKGEIAETLKQARQALEAFVENPQDPTRMRFCLTYVHQVQGTLQMVEFYGAALLAEEMEQLVQALLDGRVPNQGEALEVLMQAILQLPVYLDRIQTARRDLPMVVLPLLNDLRAARGEKLLSETSLFAPDLSQRQPQLDGEAIAQLRTDELGGLLRKLRQTQQMALVGLLRNQDVATSLGYLARVYARLEGLCREAPLGPLWSIASGLVEGLANGSVVNSASVRTLLRQLDRELKRLVEQGADGLNQAAPDELVKNLLFYVAKAPSQSPRIRALKEQYRLDEALPDHETVDAERARLAGPDRDAMRSVVGALCEELVRIKDSLDLFVRSDRGHPSELDALLAPLKQIADTLAVLGFGQPRKVILDQLDVIHALAQGRREPSDAILMDVAGALLYVEATLAGMAGPGDERNSEESRLPTTDVAQIHQLVIKEARNGLEQAKDAIIEFIASQWNHEHLARVPELLTQVRGGLAMIPLERAATLLETCNRYIQEQLLARKAVPDWQSLDTLADAITSVEYYLERLSEDHASQSDLILDVAEDSLANLGYTLKPNSSAPAEPSLSGPAAIESPAAEPERPEAVVEVAETAEQPPADTTPAEAAREDAPLLASDDNWTLGEVVPDAGEPSLDLALDLPLDDSAEVPPALPEVVEESGQPQSTPAPARSLDDFSLDEIDLSGLDLPADAAPASGPAALADWSLPEPWGLGDDLAQPAQADETLDLSLEEPALSFDAPLESLEPLPALEPFDGSAEQELVLDALDPLPLDVALPEAEGEVSAWEGSSLEELDLSDLDLPEVQLPEAEAPPAAEALASAAPALSLAEVMAAPVQPINPPAQNVPVSLLPPPADEEPVDEELREVFIEEAGEVLETLGRYLPAWKADHDDRDALTEVRRAFHTLKGSGRMVRALVIGELAWSIENLFNRVLDRSIAASEPVQRVVDQVVALLPELVEEFAANAQRQRDDVDLLAATAHALSKGEPLPEPPAPDDGGVPPEAGAEQPSSLDNGVQAPPLADAPQAAAEAQSDVELLDPQLLEIFTNEAETHLEALVGFLADCARELPQPVTDALQRALHTLKGGARMAEIGEIGDLAHELEFLYEGLCGGRLRASPALFGLLQRCHDELAEMLEAVRGHRTLPDGQALIAEIRRLRSDPDEQLSVPTSVSLKPLAAKGAAADESEILDIFLEEADDLLENLELALGRWDGGNGDAQPLDDLLRILHTLKGGARLAGQTELGNLAHDLEQHLTDAQQQGAPWPDSLLLDAQSGLEGLQRQVDLLREQLAEDDEAGERPEPAQALVQADDTDRAVASALAELTRLAPAAGAIMAAEAAPPAAPATTLPFVRKAQEAAQEAASRRAPQELVKVPAELLENLVNLAGETSIFRGRVEQQVSDVGFTLGEMESTIERVRDQLRRLDTETQAQILSRHQADAERAGYEEFDPLEMDRYSQLQQLSRALFESASDLLDLKETLAAKNRDAETLLLQQARVNTELQEGLMRTRMVPFDRLVPRLRRIVRQVAGELGKQVEFVVGNADGEMDRTVLERIVAPLEHMLRNAVDHGIESGETRRAAGKPEHGTIRLNIGREGGDILLTLSDDGAGIRLDAVRRKAIERGLMSADSDLSDHEVLQFVLESGFSTAEKVTQISGRGVGLDVANSEVKQLGGSVSIQTEPGQGTRFNVRLPFTVSVNRALMVLSGEDLYAVPLNTIEGIVRVSPYELEALYDQRGEAGLDTPSFEYAGQSYELKYLGELLNNGQEPKLVGQSLPLPVILVRSSEHAVAVQVDSLAGSREIVVKSLGPQFAGVAGISGATLLGDGRVVVILDLLATIRSRHALLGQENRRERLALRQEMAASESEQQRPPLVMVVDDSVTVRKVTTRLLERNGMNVLTAKDGVDAIAQLQEHRPDILLLDIEMPRMDGFEVATLVRHDERLGNLPIIMITSRTGEKHRERALGIGVNQYLGKPYQETELLEAIQSLVGQHE